MDRVLNRLDVIDARLGSLEKSVDARLTSLEKSVDARFASVDARFDAVNHKINVLYWLIGLAVPAAIAAAKFL